MDASRTAAAGQRDLARLKQLGFEILPPANTPNLVTGRVPVARLAALAELEFLRYIAPEGVS
jgi:hypothetical protein